MKFNKWIAGTVSVCVIAGATTAVQLGKPEPTSGKPIPPMAFQLWDVRGVGIVMAYDVERFIVAYGSE